MTQPITIVTKLKTVECTRIQQNCYNTLVVRWWLEIFFFYEIEFEQKFEFSNFTGFELPIQN